MDDAVYLGGIGTALPPHRFGQDRIAHFLSEVANHQPEAKPAFARAIRSMSERSGIRTRASVLPDYGSDRPSDFRFFPANWALDPFPTTADRMKVYEQSVSGLALDAARKALMAADRVPSDVTHLVFTTCTGFFAPGPDVRLMQSLRLSPSTRRVQVGFMGCYAGFNALRTAWEISRGDPEAVILVVAAELCTLHLQRDLDLSAYVSNLLFADGAAAAVISRRRSFARMLGTHTWVAADSQDEMSWRVGDHGFIMHLSAQVPDRLRADLPPFMQRLAQAGGRGRRQVDRFAVHPGGPKVLEAVQQALQVNPDSMEESHSVLRDCGNMSSATIFFVLDRSLRRSGVQAALGFGPGLTMEGILLEAEGS